MRSIIYILTILFISACAPKTLSFYVMDESNINYTTFSFYARDRQNLIEQKAKLDSLIENVITSQLLNKGYTHTSPSEMYVSYKIMTDKTYKNQNSNGYDPSAPNGVGYPRNYSSNYNNQMNNNYVVERKEGVFMIDLYDNNDKLIWQGTKAYKVGKSTDIRALLISHIGLILADFKSNL